MLRGADLSDLEFNKYIRVLSDYLTRVYIGLGRPEANINNNNFWIMIDEIINNWSLIYKDEAEDFVNNIKLDRAVEMSLNEMNKKNIWKKSVAYPQHFYQMVKIFFPSLKLQDRKFITKFISRYPKFNASNYT